MNGFRITLLVLLGLAVGALLCIVTIFQNSQEENYAAYQTRVQADERQQQIEEHKARMERIGPKADGLGTEELEAAAAAQAESINKAEEDRVLANAQRKDAARVAEQAREEASEDKPLGLVASYDKEWGFLMVKTVTDEPLPVGTVVAVRRNGTILCEAEVGEKDPDSGQFSATVRQTEYNSGKEGNIAAEKFEPITGDEVILTPFQSSRDLRAGTGQGSSIMTVLPGPSASPGLMPAGSFDYDGPIEEEIPEVDAALTPMP